MDLGLLAAILMLLVWGVGVFALDAPGWINLLLSIGVFLAIWRMVTRGTRAADATPPAKKP